MKLRILATILWFFAVHSFPATINLSGTVTDLTGNVLSGAGITLVGAQFATSSSSGGRWHISIAQSGVISRSRLLAISPRSLLMLDGNRLRLRLDGVDAVGRRSINPTENQHPAHKATAVSATARSSTDLVDTLLYSWNGRVRARVGVASLSAGELGTQSIDTSTDSSDIPWNSSIAYGSLTDVRDGQIYRTVKIGNQTWMAQNLNYLVDSSWCTLDTVDSCIKSGRMYQWTALMGLDTSYNNKLWGGTLPHQGICPTGWHLPTDSEWTILKNFADSTSPGPKLRSTKGWYKPGTDTFGFRGLPTYARVSVTWPYYTPDNSFWTVGEPFATRASNTTLGSRYGYGDLRKNDGIAARCLMN